MTGKDALALVRDATATFAGLSGLAYAAGYLALRARARALGIEPDFPLLDAVYVFSGFRLVLGLLFVLLLLAPFLWVARQLGVFIGKRPRAAAVVSALALLLLAVGVAAQFQVLDAQGELLAPPPRRPLEDAVLGANAWGVALLFAAVAAASLGASWLYERLRQARRGGVTPALALIVAMQLLFLPALWGVFFGDRQVRVLEHGPEAVSGLCGPVGLIDRGKDRVVVLSVAPGSAPLLMTLPADKIDGIGVTRIVTLQQFLGEMRTAATVACGAAIVAHPLAALADANGGDGRGRAPPVAARSAADPFWRVVVGQLKHTLDNIGSLGEGRAGSGVVFEADFEGGRLAGPPHRLSVRADLSWPVTGDDGQVYALDGGRLVRLTAAGAAEPVNPPAGPWRKLVGVGPSGVVVGVLAEPSPFGRPALLSPGGTLQVGPAPVAAEDRQRQGVLLQESQTLDGGRRLTVARSARGGRGFDVFYAKPGVVNVDVSDCGDDSCGQPSMPPNGSKIVYIRQARWADATPGR